MNLRDYLEAKSPEALRAAVNIIQRFDPGSLAAAEQAMTAINEARRLAPVENSRLVTDPAVERAMLFALGHRGDSEGEGPVPIVHCKPMFTVDGARETTRHGSAPITSDAPIQWCVTCFERCGNRTAFWFFAGEVIVQLDLCPKCSVKYIDLGAVPQADFDSFERLANEG